MMEAAIGHTKNGMSKRAAAKLCGVERRTLTRHMLDPDLKPVGAPRKIPQWEEDRLADFLLECSDQGIPFNRHHCMQLFSQVAAELRK